LGVTLVPVITDQANQLVNRFPGLLSASQENIAAIDHWARLRRLPVDFQGFSRRLSIQIENQLQTIAPQAIEVALGTLSGLVDSILVFVLAFYMLLDGNRLWRGLINLLPSHIGLPLASSLRLNFQNFFISQILLALAMVLALIPVFIILKVPFALLFALLIGVAELIPFFGATLGIGLVTILVMLQDLGLGFQVAIAATILQQLRDNILAPRMMGNLTGLNPLWIFIALLMGLQIAGFLGAIVSVPIAGTIKGTLDAIRVHNSAPAAQPAMQNGESDPIEKN
jgi:predicted PurR-regulated permease PerM